LDKLPSKNSRQVIILLIWSLFEGLMAQGVHESQYLEANEAGIKAQGTLP
jgi:hypothetical protein